MSGPSPPSPSRGHFTLFLSPSLCPSLSFSFSPSLSLSLSLSLSISPSLAFSLFLFVSPTFSFFVSPPSLSFIPLYQCSSFPLSFTLCYSLLSLPSLWLYMHLSPSLSLFPPLSPSFFHHTSLLLYRSGHTCDERA